MPHHDTARERCCKIFQDSTDFFYARWCMFFVASELLVMPRPRAPRLSAPFLKRVVLDESRIENRAAFPFSLAVFQKGFELEFDRAVTILIGENGIGKSTILAGIAAVAGYEDAGRVTSSRRMEPAIGDRLAHALRPSWLPRMTNGWFFRRESFFSLLPRREDPAPLLGVQPPSNSHGEEFLDFVEERRHRQGVFIFDEPEAALSPARQIEFLKLLRRMESSCQVIMATHSPLLMAFPGARLLRLSERGFKTATVETTDHYRLLLGFCTNPREFVRVALEE
jgi:predicted ATPase